MTDFSETVQDYAKRVMDAESKAIEKACWRMLADGKRGVLVRRLPMTLSMDGDSYLATANVEIGLDDKVPFLEVHYEEVRND